MVHRLKLAYRGTAYAGWQRQPNARAVQQVVEEALADLLGEEVTIVGAGRTDAGVHARGQIAHLRPGREFPLRGLVHGANTRLPEDIRILAADRMPDGFDARRSASAKEYRYRLVRTEVLSPLDAPFSVRVAPGADLRAMREAATALVGRHDFGVFALAGGSHRDPRRRIQLVDWRERGELLVLRLVGDGFLRGMVRSIVGTLLEVGAGRREPGEIGHLLSGRPRSEAGPTAPARGLVMHEVFYPPEWRLPGDPEGPSP
ncbi:MAG: tRNA pseudouridine(38-40) synthase TruA [Thermoanaerobaculia bacterium]